MCKKHLAPSGRLVKSLANQRGIALIQVLLLSAILALMAMQFTLSSRQQVTIATDLQNKMLAEIELRTQESRLLLTLLTQSKNEAIRETQLQNDISNKWNFYGKPFSMSANTSASIQDLNGLISLYGVNNIEMLKTLLTFWGIEKQRINTIVSNLLHWQGFDSQLYSSKFGAAVRGDYLLSVTELRNIPGIDNTLYEKLSPMVTTLQNLLYNPINSPLPILQSQLSPEIYHQIAMLRDEGNLTSYRFVELTQSYNDDIVTFTTGNRLQIKLVVSVGSSIVTRSFICELDPEGVYPVVWYQ